jgi:hypothetical protein
MVPALLSLRNSFGWTGGWPFPNNTIGSSIGENCIDVMKNYDTGIVGRTDSIFLMIQFGCILTKPDYFYLISLIHDQSEQ